MYIVLGSSSISLFFVYSDSEFAYSDSEFCVFSFWKTCFEIYKTFIKLSLPLHCLVYIGFLMLILHMCLILLHNNPLRVPFALHSSLSAINFPIPIFFVIMFVWYLCPSFHFQLLFTFYFFKVLFRIFSFQIVYSRLIYIFSSISVSDF